MNAFIVRYTERVDNATLRERALIFLAGALILIFIFNSLLIQPLHAEQKALSVENAKLEQELKALQEGLQRMVQGGVQEVDAGNRAKEGALRAQLSALSGRIAEEQRRFTPPERMREALEDLLRHNPRLALVSLKSVPPAPLAKAGSGTPGLFRHGIELTVRGGYVDLYEYLKTLEKLPIQFYWGKADLAAGGYPALTLTLTLYTVSFDRAWLIV